jgi:ketosteroid isomerase-like protein
MTIEKDRANDEAAIRELIRRFAVAFRDRDVDGVMAPFDHNIVSFDILPPLQTVGANAFVTHWEQFFEAHAGSHSRGVSRCPRRCW